MSSAAISTTAGVSSPKKIEVSPFTATDTAEEALERLRARLAARGVGDRVARGAERRHGATNSARAPWPVIWTEGSAWIIGVETALAAWRARLRPCGVLVLSDMVWRTDTPDEGLRAFWAPEYPVMAKPETRLAQAKRAGYRVLGHFEMGTQAMDTYHLPLEAHVDAMQERLAGSRVRDDLRTELSAWDDGKGQFSIEMFVLQRP